MFIVIVFLILCALKKSKHIRGNITNFKTNQYDAVWTHNVSIEFKYS